MAFVQRIDRISLAKAQWMVVTADNHMGALVDCEDTAKFIAASMGAYPDLFKAMEVLPVYVVDGKVYFSRESKTHDVLLKELYEAVVL